MQQCKTLADSISHLVSASEASTKKTSREVKNKQKKAPQHTECNFYFNNNHQKKQPIPSYVFGGNKASIS